MDAEKRKQEHRAAITRTTTCLRPNEEKIDFKIVFPDYFALGKNVCP